MMVEASMETFLVMRSSSAKNITKIIKESIRTTKDYLRNFNSRYLGGLRCQKRFLHRFYHLKHHLTPSQMIC